MIYNTCPNSNPDYFFSQFGVLMKGSLHTAAASRTCKDTCMPRGALLSMIQFFVANWDRWRLYRTLQDLPNRRPIILEDLSLAKLIFDSAPKTSRGPLDTKIIHVFAASEVGFRYRDTNPDLREHQKSRAPTLDSSIPMV